MIRNELEIVYDTLTCIVAGYPFLSGRPAAVYDYSPNAVKAASYPCIGIRRIAESLYKHIDKNEEYKRTDSAGSVFAWYEAGNFEYTCSVGLYMTVTEQVPNPVPYLRGWSQWLQKHIVRHVRFDCEYDPSGSGESLIIKSAAQPFETYGKLLYSVKHTFDVKGKLLVGELLRGPVSSSGSPAWKVHQNPYVWKEE
ncbi:MULTISPECIES: hypothetical protein [unclassified Paenibacillus]|uniref:hypothetical protein n=1 Tax=unclassified Paenibacillus TaxID=185978 RepID=UPI00362FA17A